MRVMGQRPPAHRQAQQEGPHPGRKQGSRSNGQRVAQGVELSQPQTPLQEVPSGRSPDNRRQPRRALEQ
eukprot:5795043-Heterocapsa_arctica.AAC.1